MGVESAVDVVRWPRTVIPMTTGVWMRERRRIRRVMPRGDVWCRVKSSLPARLVDISPLGVQVEIPAPLEPLAEVGVSIPVIGGTVWLRARVQRCRAAGVGMTGSADRGMVYRAGLEFTSAGQSEVRAIRAAYGPADLEAVDGPSISDSGSTKVTIVVPDDRLRKLG